MCGENVVFHDITPPLALIVLMSVEVPWGNVLIWVFIRVYSPWDCIKQFPVESYPLIHINPSYEFPCCGVKQGVSCCQVWEIYRCNSGNSGHQVWTYEMSEGTSASAYVLCPFLDSCPKISERGDQKIRVSIGVVLRVEPRGWVIKVGTYSIFELKYFTWHVRGIYTKYQNKQRDKSENNKTNKIHKEYKVSTENKEFVVLGVVTSRVQELKNTRLYINYLF